MDECLCERCGEWFPYSESDCVNESTTDTPDYHWYCDSCLETEA